jgi:alpha-amylase
MNNVNIVFAVHNHQPIGNFENVFEEVYTRAYKPFLDVLKRHPDVKFTQHWTGTLLDWVEKRHPEFLRELKSLVRRGQLEILTGAYYEAILPVIPRQDRVGQIRKLTTRVRDLFGSTPRGMWLAERVWEPHLVSALWEAGVEFVVVDDTHFRMAGLVSDQLRGYFVTEDEGKTLHVFPIDKTLRYTIPFRALAETRQYLQRTASSNGADVVVHADDGEKFGAWPKTYESVYEEGWLESFCAFLESNRSWLHTLHFSDVLDSRGPSGRIYLPTASYHEMMKWVLPPTPFVRLERFEHRLKEDHSEDEAAMFVRGGFWRNFLAKYPEANHMHKRMLRVSARVHASGLKGRARQEALDLLWASQCNDPYWHGVFGGFYLPNLRYAVYHRLLKAESKLDERDGLKRPLVEESDMDCDGAKEIIVESPLMNLYFKPSAGGALVELDFKPAGINLLDIVSRREEGYHRRLIAGEEDPGDAEENVYEEQGRQEGDGRQLHFDWYRHASLVDHFFAPDTTIEAFRACRYLELGDFVNGPYDADVAEKRGVAVVTLTRDGAIWREGKPHRITLRKRIRFDRKVSIVQTDYEIVNRESVETDIWFGVEFNTGLMAGDAPDRYYEIGGREPEDPRLRSSGETPDVSKVRLVDDWLGVETAFEMSRPAMLWRCPIETVSLSESGLERVYQSSMIVPNWKFRLQRSFGVRLTQTIKSRPGRGTPAGRRGKTGRRHAS